MFNVNDDYSKLKVCAVGSVFLPEYFDYVNDSQIKDSIQKLMIETEEDLRTLITLLQSFGVEIIRPLLPEEECRLIKPMITPRDHMLMLGSSFYIDKKNKSRQMAPMINLLRDNGNDVIIDKEIRSSFLISDGTMMLWSTDSDSMVSLNDLTEVEFNRLANITARNKEKQELSQKRNLFSLANHQMSGIIGPLKGKISILGPKLLSVVNDDAYIRLCQKWFKDFDMIIVEDQESYIISYNELCKKNGMRWWIKGSEYAHSMTDFIRFYMKHWIGMPGITTYGNEILMIDESNAVTVGLDSTTVDALSKRGIKTHIVEFRHRFFWNCGILRLTSDLDRQSRLPLP